MASQRSGAAGSGTRRRPTAPRAGAPGARCSKWARLEVAAVAPEGVQLDLLLDAAGSATRSSGTRTARQRSFTDEHEPSGSFDRAQERHRPSPVRLDVEGQTMPTGDSAATGAIDGPAGRRAVAHAEDAVEQAVQDGSTVTRERRRRTGCRGAAGRSEPSRSSGRTEKRRTRRPGASFGPPGLRRALRRGPAYRHPETLRQHLAPGPNGSRMPPSRAVPIRLDRGRRVLSGPRRRHPAGRAVPARARRRGRAPAETQESLSRSAARAPTLRRLRPCRSGCAATSAAPPI